MSVLSVSARLVGLGMEQGWEDGENLGSMSDGPILGEMFFTYNLIPIPVMCCLYLCTSVYTL